MEELRGRAHELYGAQVEVVLERLHTSAGVYHWLKTEAADEVAREHAAFMHEEVRYLAGLLTAAVAGSTGGGVRVGLALDEAFARSLQGKDVGERAAGWLSGYHQAEGYEGTLAEAVLSMASPPVLPPCGRGDCSQGELPGEFRAWLEGGRALFLERAERGYVWGTVY